MITGKASFKFDSKQVYLFMDKQTAALMRRVGGYLRMVARRSMRKRKGPSQPGTPPNAHEQPLLRTFLEYAFDPIKRRLVVGPKLLPRSNNFVIPGLMERGGVIQAKRKDTTFAKNYPARPFMKPALEKQSKNLLMNSLRGQIQ